MLAAHHLRKNYGSLSAVADVNFSLNAGEILGYIGSNGAGKSTTVKMIAGLIEPSSGEVLFNGISIHRSLVDYKRHIGYVPEEPNLYPYLTAREYLDMVATLRGMSRTRRLEKIDALLKLFSLYAQRHFPLSAYSKGMRQKVLLISGMLHNPDLIIFDEPLSGLDITASFIFRKLLTGLAREGKAIFYCSHVLEVVEKLCTHVGIIVKGQLVEQGSLAAIRQGGSLEDCFLKHAGADPDAARTLNRLEEAAS